MIGTLLLVGVYKSSNKDLFQLWHIKHGKLIFPKIISRNRFQDILPALWFDNAAAQRSCRSSDKFSPIRNILEILNESLLDAFVPGPNVTIYEQLATFRGCCLFREYTPSKSKKYGIEIWAICNSTPHYIVKMDVYKGREIGEPRETNLDSKLVLKLSEPFKKSERNITCDNFLTSLELGRKLLMQNLTIVGTIRKNRLSFLQNLCPPKTLKNPLLSIAIKKKRWLCPIVPRKGRWLLFWVPCIQIRVLNRRLQKSLRTTVQRNQKQCRYHEPNGEMIYFQKKNSKIAHGNIL